MSPSLSTTQPYMQTIGENNIILNTSPRFAVQSEQRSIQQSGFITSCYLSCLVELRWVEFEHRFAPREASNELEVGAPIASLCTAQRVDVLETQTYHRTVFPKLELTCKVKLFIPIAGGRAWVRILSPNLSKVTLFQQSCSRSSAALRKIYFSKFGTAILTAGK